jgi:hypothetical protein
MVRFAQDNLQADVQLTRIYAIAYSKHYLYN